MDDLDSSEEYVLTQEDQEQIFEDIIQDLFSKLNKAEEKLKDQEIYEIKLLKEISKISIELNQDKEENLFLMEELTRLTKERLRDIEEAGESHRVLFDQGGSITLKFEDMKKQVEEFEKILNITDLELKRTIVQRDNALATAKRADLEKKKVEEIFKARLEEYRKQPPSDICEKYIQEGIRQEKERREIEERRERQEEERKKRVSDESERERITQKLEEQYRKIDERRLREEREREEMRDRRLREEIKRLELEERKRLELEREQSLIEKALNPEDIDIDEFENMVDVFILEESWNKRIRDVDNIIDSRDIRMERKSSDIDELSNITKNSRMPLYDRLKAFAVSLYALNQNFRDYEIERIEKYTERREREVGKGIPQDYVKKSTIAERKRTENDIVWLSKLKLIMERVFKQYFTDIEKELINPERVRQNDIIEAETQNLFDKMKILYKNISQLMEVDKRILDISKKIISIDGTSFIDKRNLRDSDDRKKMVLMRGEFTDERNELLKSRNQKFEEIIH